MQHAIYGIFFSLLVGILSLVPALSARAEELPLVRFSEISWAGSSAGTADEWLELANLGDTPVDLSGWVIAGAATSGEALAVAPGVIIAPHTTLLIANFAQGASSTLAVAPDLVTSALALPNSNLTLILAMPDGLVVDQYEDSGTLQIGSSTPIRASATRDLVTLTWATATTSAGLTESAQLGTPGSATFPAVETPEATVESSAEPASEPVPEQTPPPDVEITPPEVTNETSETVPEATPNEPIAESSPEELSEEPVNPPVTEPTIEPAPEEPVPEEPPASPDVVIADAPLAPPPPPPAAPLAPIALEISELLPIPDDGPEWVEIHNVGTTPAMLIGWTLTDASAHATPLPELTLAAGAYVVIESPAGNLNNSGDTVTLIAPDDTIIDSIAYGDAPAAPARGMSLNRSTTGWYAAAPTAGVTNTPAESPALPSPTLSPSYVPSSPITTPPRPAVAAPAAAERTVGSSRGAPAAPAPAAAPAARTYRIVAVADAVTAAEEPDDSAETREAAATSAPAPSGVADLAATDDGTDLEVRGVIVAAPGTFARRTAFLDGVELYFHAADWPELPVGTPVIIQGELRNDGTRPPRLMIRSADAIEIDGAQEIAIPVPYAPDLPHGSFVTLHGTIIGTEERRATLQQDDGTTVTIEVANATGIAAGSLGGEMTIVGILRTDTGSPIVFPRAAEDLTVHTTPVDTPAATTAPDTLAFPPSSNRLLGGGLVGGTLLTLLSWFVAARRHAPAAAI